MGVPGFYRTILSRYKNKNVYKLIGEKGTEKVEYLYIDFNPIIYLALLQLQTTGALNGLSVLQLETKLIETIILSTKEIVNELIKPTELLYIAIDGPAPKCKIVTQRARRYKAIYETEVKKYIRSQYKADVHGTTTTTNWDKANITPGTRFMENLDESLRRVINAGAFKCNKIILSDSTIPSEGEHKITQHVKTLGAIENQTIVIYSNDGDMAFLALQFPEKTMFTMIDSGFLPKPLKKSCADDYILFDNNAFHDIFVEDLFYDKYADVAETTDAANAVDDQPAILPIKTDLYTKDRLLLDFLCVSFFGGNDFVRPIPFGKIRNSGTYQMYLSVYRKARLRHENDYLVSKDGEINHAFLSDILFLLARQEPRKMYNMQQEIIKHTQEQPQFGPFDAWEDEWSEYQHTPYQMPGHPEHSLVRDQLLSFSYHDTSQHETWKGQYYAANFDLKPNGDRQEYNNQRARICKAYLKSIIFTLKYYLTGKPPSWRWNYHYEVAPWPSDLFIALKKTDLKKLGEFYENVPYKAMEQLLLTVPPTSSVFPLEYRIFSRWLPGTSHILLDRVNGDKYIYAEPILRPVNEPRLLEETKKVQLTPVSVKRNRINPIFIYRRNV